MCWLENEKSRVFGRTLKEAAADALAKRRSPPVASVRISPRVSAWEVRGAMPFVNAVEQEGSKSEYGLGNCVL